MASRIVYVSVLGLLISTTALARVIHPPQPTHDAPGDAPADGIVTPRQIDVDASSGDVSVTFNRNATIVTHGRLGRARTPEVVNAPDVHQAAPVTAVTESANETTADNDDAVVEIYTESNGIRFASGGVGKQEAAHIKTLQKDFRLKLQFAASSGHFLSDVTVTLHNKAGEEVVTLTTEGPTLLVDLPAGAYTVTAVYDDSKVSKPITVPNKGMKGYTIVFTEPVI